MAFSIYALIDQRYPLNHEEHYICIGLTSRSVGARLSGYLTTTFWEGKGRGHPEIRQVIEEIFEDLNSSPQMKILEEGLSEHRARNLERDLTFFYMDQGYNLKGRIPDSIRQKNSLESYEESLREGVPFYLLPNKELESLLKQFHQWVFENIDSINSNNHLKRSLIPALRVDYWYYTIRNDWGSLDMPSYWKSLGFNLSVEGLYQLACKKDRYADIPCVRGKQDFIEWYQSRIEQGFTLADLGLDDNTWYVR